MAEKKPKAAKPEKAPAKMDEATIIILQELVDDANTDITAKYEKYFEKTGARKHLIKELKKEKVSQEVIDTFKITSINPDQMIGNFGCQFSIIPSVLDGVTKRPIKGTVCFLRVVNKVEFDITKGVAEGHINRLKKYLEKDPKNKTLLAALKASEGLLKTSKK